MGEEAHETRNGIMDVSIPLNQNIILYLLTVFGYRSTFIKILANLFQDKAKITAMKRFFLSISAFLSVIFITVACSQKTNCMAFTDETSFVENFPHRLSLTNPEVINHGILGTNDFKIMDSLMIISTSDKEYAWKFISLDVLGKCGEAIRIGNGPHEFLFAPWPSQCEFTKEKGLTYCYLPDKDKKQMLRMNLSESVRERNSGIETVRDNIPYPYPCPNTVRIDDSTYFCTTLSSDMTQRERLILKNSERIYPETWRQINEVHVSPGTNPNLLSAGVSFKRDRKLIIETPIALKNINLYSLDGKVKKTVCIGKRLTSIGDLEKLDANDIPVTFTTTQVYDNFFAVMYLGETAWSYGTGRTEMPHIYCFDYDGNPIADILIDRQATGFDFDFAGRRLYVLDLDTESMWRYELPEREDWINILSQRL